MHVKVDTLANDFRSLLDIDYEPSAHARANAEKLISAELSPDHASSLHSSIPAFPEPQFSPLMQQELERKAAGLPLTGGIDLSRYEAPEPPARKTDAEEILPRTSMNGAGHYRRPTQPVRICL